MVDFITEVQDELRKDDYNRWLRKYGPYLAGLIVAVIAVTGYLEWDKARDAAAARALSVSYSEAAKLSESDVDGAIAAFDRIASEAPEGYAGLSHMRAAALEAERGNRMEAVRHLDLAADVFEQPRHIQLAKLKAAYLLSAEGRHADAQARLSGLTEKGAPFEFLARELSGYAALSQDDLTRAKQQFTYLATIPGVSPPIQERAQQTLSLLDAQAAAEAAQDIDADTTDDTLPAGTDADMETDNE